MSGKTLSRRSFVGAAGVFALAGLAACGSRGEASSASVGSSSVASEASSSSSASSSSASSSAASSSSSAASATASSSSSTSSAGSSAGAGKSLIVLWSWSGNTLQMAERLSELSGAEIYRIEAADPYPEDYNACTDRAKQEQDDGVYPEIANPVQNWGDYDTIFLGYPIWWYELPMIVQGFVNDHDWSGKTIVPFNSHEGSGNGGTYADLREMTGATVLDGLAIRGESVSTSLDQVDAWYENLGL